MRSRDWLVALVAVVGVTLSYPMDTTVAAQSGTIVISEYRFRGPAGANDEFIELFNAALTPVNVSGWQIRSSNNVQPPGLFTRATIPNNTFINPGCYYLVTNVASGGFSGGVAPNLTYTVGFADNGGVALTTSNVNTIVDQVGQGTVATAYGEGTRLPMLSTNVNRGIERRPGGTEGHVDTDNNAADFREIAPGNPQNSDPLSCLSSGVMSVTASLSPASVEQGHDLTLYGMVIAGTVPPSTGIQVIGDLSSVGGSATTALFDNGVFPDQTAGDLVFSATVTVPHGNPVGARPITLTATDVQGRTASNTIQANVVSPAVIYRPHDIQGAGAVSPMAPGTSVTVRGVVFARTANGFFIQTETGMEDPDDTTSEGLFISSGGAMLAAAQVGHVVNVTGSVAEFPPDPGSASVTQLNAVAAVNDLGDGAVPPPFVLTTNEVSDAGTLDQLERFEGMRVSASLTAVSGSDSGHAFYAVVTGQGRPFRSEGVEVGLPVLPCAIGPCHVPVFDGNPERLRVDSDGLEGVAAVALSTGAVMTDVTGPLDFSARTYTVLPETMLAFTGGTPLSVAAPPLGHQFTVASLNLDRFYDAGDHPGADEVLSPAFYAARLSKASATIRNVLAMPDIIAVQEVENLGVLVALANAIENDAVATGQQAPQYSTYLFEGSRPDLLDTGFLVKKVGARVAVRSIEQVGADATFVDPSDNMTHLVHQQPPLVLRAFVTGGSTSLPQTVTVIANHLDPSGSDATSRATRQAQAEFLADFIQVRQSNDPSEAIVSVGNYNAFDFNDGYVDVVGTVRGNPVSPDQVATEPHDLVSPDLVSGGGSVPPAERYTAVDRGNAQTFDHVLMSAALGPQFAGLVYPRLNADFPEVLRGDATTPARLSDRDPVVAYFTFPPDVDAPVFSVIPEDLLAEATGPDGAAVSYETPTASDNLDPFVEVTCVPVSGSTFPLGDTRVSCVATDAAGNSANGSFSVTITQPLFGRMAGVGRVNDGGQRTWFAFDVKESPSYMERGFVVVQVRDGHGRPDRYLSATVTSVRFSNADGYAPGRGPRRADFARRGGDRYPRSGVDTVVFTGVGSWNGRGGHRFEITASDRGEPGPRRDTFSLTVFAPDGTVVASASGTLHDGNIQSLR